MSSKLRIGTRNSALATWQAEFIKSQLEASQIESEIVFIKSEGEINLTTPLYEIGVEGIFTKALDIALLENKIDIAVHSLKDVPTQIANGLILAATPKRGNHRDVLVYKQELPEDIREYVVATSSLRRKAQWLNKYPNSIVQAIRGNINSRAEKLICNPNLDAVIFAAAGLDRINLRVPNRLDLDWLLPAPAQGVLAVLCREDDTHLKKQLQILHHKETFICAGLEREFLRELMGGCSVPIAAHAYFDGQHLHFKGAILTCNGSKKMEISQIVDRDNYGNLGKISAQKLLNKGAGDILAEVKREMVKNS